MPKSAQKPNLVEVVLVGDELLKGERQDAHLRVLSRRLVEAGVRVGAGHTVGDDRAAIARIVGDAMATAQVVIVSGGLGPTHDDITREGVADALGLGLEYNDDEFEHIKAIFERMGSSADESNRRQAYFPKGARIMANPNGTAAGFMVDRDDVLVAVLPGPPKELNPMFESDVLPEIRHRFPRAPILMRTFRTTGIGESAMTPLVKDIFEAFAEFEVASLPHVGGVDIVITQRDERTEAEALEGRAAEFEGALRGILGAKVYAVGSKSFEAVIGEALATRGATLAVAESLTGGLIGKRITDVPGSSAYLLADVVAYSNEAKMDFLGVSTESLAAHGAVSETVCREVAHGVRERTGATFALATTGIAGPGGGSEEKPVGLTWYGLAWDGGDRIRHRVFGRSRADVRSRVAYATLLLLHEHLQAR